MYSGTEEQPIPAGLFQSGIKQVAIVKALIRPEDISILLIPVEGVSLRNRINGKIENVFSRNGFSFCYVDSSEELLVEITEVSRVKMKLGRKRIFSACLNQER